MNSLVLHSVRRVMGIYESMPSLQLANSCPGEQYSDYRAQQQVCSGMYWRDGFSVLMDIKPIWELLDNLSGITCQWLTVRYVMHMTSSQYMEL